MKYIHEILSDVYYSFRVISRLLATEVLMCGVVYLNLFMFSAISLFYRPTNSDTLVVRIFFLSPSCSSHFPSRSSLLILSHLSFLVHAPTHTHSLTGHIQIIVSLHKQHCTHTVPWLHVCSLLLVGPCKALSLFIHVLLWMYTWSCSGHLLLDIHKV